MSRLPGPIAEISFSLGVDHYKRRVILKRRRNYDGKDIWSIDREPSDQMDQTETVTGLTAENLRQIAQALDIMPEQTT